MKLIIVNSFAALNDENLNNIIAIKVVFSDITMQKYITTFSFIERDTKP